MELIYLFAAVGLLAIIGIIYAWTELYRQSHHTTKKLQNPGIKKGLPVTGSPFPKHGNRGNLANKNRHKSVTESPTTAIL